MVLKGIKNEKNIYYFNLHNYLLFLAHQVQKKKKIAIQFLSHKKQQKATKKPIIQKQNKMLLPNHLMTVLILRRLSFHFSTQHKNLLMTNRQKSLLKV